MKCLAAPFVCKRRGRGQEGLPKSCGGGADYFEGGRKTDMWAGEVVPRNAIRGTEADYQRKRRHVKTNSVLRTSAAVPWLRVDSAD